MNLTRFVKQSSVKLLKKGRFIWLYNPELLDDFCPSMFTIEYWQQKQAIIGSATGRGTSWFLSHPNVNLVWRHYLRGGLVGKINKDHYLYTALAHTRATKEYQLLAQLQQEQLPVPKPIALQIKRHGLSYQADIMIELIPGAKDLVGVLRAQPMAQAYWHKIGQVIRQFHDKQVYHHDLNAHNIMLDHQDKVWLIDFDQGAIKATSSSWKKQNLQRLLRSFEKENGLHKSSSKPFHWQPQNWQWLMDGYEGRA
ncbi:3-deoxy-D-manno-octulosonic acid kinase [Thalassotalea aquiviva]|uniref:3-deoxy-D-manno-octulosonic acid kinase n=1 Tax=Thalassotalea aquiviva TaxID=3242415 RepID=UPI00352AD914